MSKQWLRGRPRELLKKKAQAAIRLRSDDSDAWQEKPLVSLDTKRGKFIWHADGSTDGFAYNISTSRKLPKQSIISIDPTIEAGVALHQYRADERIRLTEPARRKLETLWAKHLTHERAIAEGFEKYKTTFIEDIAFETLSTPFPHQAQGASFALQFPGSLLLMDPGTGKSFTSILVLLKRMMDIGIQRVLVACPLSVIPVWYREFNKHIKADVCVSEFTEELETKADVMIRLINYDILARQKKAILKWKPQFVIADEIHRIRNPEAKWSKALHKIGDAAPFRIGLTGTPIGQDPLDVWSQYRFASPDTFGRSFSNFEDRYAKKGGYMGLQVIGYKNLSELSAKMHSVAFRCTAKECLDLPGERNVRVYVPADAETRRIYSELKKDFGTIVNDEEITVDLVVSQLMKLRQITGGMVKTDGGTLEKVSQIKLKYVMDRINTRSWNHKLVVFCSFIHEIEMLTAELEGKHSYEVMRGKTTKRNRSRIQDEFQKPGGPQILVAQVGVGAEGIDLYAANEDIFYSPTFSFIQFMQAKARINRIGQTVPVTHRHLVMKDTVDEKIVDFLWKHGDLNRMILDDMRTYRV